MDIVKGAVALIVLWWTGAVAWTWYAFIGASVTSLVAVALSFAVPTAAPAAASLPTQR